MRKRSSVERGGFDVTPEHTKLTGPDHGAEHQGPLPPEMKAAYDYVDRVLHTSDYVEPLLWHGWALREAFLAGISHSQSLTKKA